MSRSDQDLKKFKTGMRRLLEVSASPPADLAEEPWPEGAAPVPEALRRRLLGALPEPAPAPAPGLLTRLRRFFTFPQPLGWGAAAALGAACLVGVLYVKGFGGVGPIAAFELDVIGEDRQLDGPGNDARPVRVHSDAQLRVVLRPVDQVLGDQLEAVAYLDQGGWRRWPVQLRARPGGVFSLEARAQDLPDLRPGLHDMAFVVARRGKLPSDVEVEPHLRLAGSFATRDWRLLRRTVEVLPAESLPPL